MDFVDKLKNGDFDFLISRSFKDNDRNSFINEIKKYEDFKTLIETTFEQIAKKDIKIAFLLTYDLREYDSIIITILNNYPTLINNNKIFYLFLYNNVLAEEYVFTNYNSIQFDGTVYDYEYDEMYPILLEYIFNHSKNKETWIKELLNQSNMHKRFILIRYMLSNNHSLKNYNLLKCVASDTENEQGYSCHNLMEISDISKLAIMFLEKNDYDNYLLLKDFILKNYPKNDLASELCNSYYSHSERKLDKDISISLLNEFKNNIEILFNTSRNYKYEIMNNFKKHLKKNTINKFNYYSNILGTNEMVMRIVELGLFDNATAYIDKYLKLSKSKKTRYLGAGTSCSCYIVGDYVIKLFKHKWGYGKVVCPNTFWAVKNLEEDYVVDECAKKIVGGIEVQPFLHKRATAEDMENLKQAILDSDYDIPNDFGGDNVRVLDSYKDADCIDFESLPEWFKKNPAVMIDRDLFEKTKHPKVKKMI